MSLIAFRVTLLACVVGTSGAWFDAAPLMWFAIALALVAIAALVADLLGVKP